MAKSKVAEKNVVNKIAAASLSIGLIVSPIHTEAKLLELGEIVSIGNLKPQPKITEQINNIGSIEKELQEIRDMKFAAMREQQDKVRAEYEERIRLEKEEKRKKFLNNVKYGDARYIDLRTQSNLSADDLDKMLAGTGLDGLGSSFIMAEKKYNVNAIYLAAHAAWESSWGESPLSVNKNNLFGFEAYDHDPYNSARYFNSKEECIMIVAKYISKNYLEKSGKHYNGANLVGMNVKYASDENWAKGIRNVMRTLVGKI